MLHNRSVPVDAILPHNVYKDLPQALAWLCSTFGFMEHYHYGEPLSGAQLHLGNGYLMVNAAKTSGQQNPSDLGYGTQSLTVFVEDIEAHYTRSRAAEEPHETIYGELQYGIRDLEAHLWVFSRPARDVDPAACEADAVNLQ